MHKTKPAKYPLKLPNIIADIIARLKLQLPSL